MDLKKNSILFIFIHNTSIRGVGRLLFPISQNNLSPAPNWLNNEYNTKH